MDDEIVKECIGAVKGPFEDREGGGISIGEVAGDCVGGARTRVCPKEGEGIEFVGSDKGEDNMLKVWWVIMVEQKLGWVQEGRS